VLLVSGAALGVSGTLVMTSPGGAEIVRVPPDGGAYQAGSVVYYGAVEDVEVWSGIRAEEMERCLILASSSGVGTIQCKPLYSTPELSAVTDTGATISVTFPSDGTLGILTSSKAP